MTPLYTEQEAGCQWCPMRRGSSATSGGHGNDPAVHEVSNCIGRRCMMWRWESEYQAFVSNRSERRGYCGLAENQE